MLIIIDNFMKKTFVIFLLFLISFNSLKAESVKEYTIEGLKVGDSLLRSFSVDKIKEFYNYDHMPSDMKYRIVEITKEDMKMKTAQQIQLSYKTDDRNYVIQSVDGLFLCNNEQDCQTIKASLEKHIRGIFKNIRGKKTTMIHPDDPTGKSTVESVSFLMDDGQVEVQYYNWSKAVEYINNVRVAVSSNNIVSWSNSNYGLK